MGILHKKQLEIMAKVWECFWQILDWGNFLLN